MLLHAFQRSRIVLNIVKRFTIVNVFVTNNHVGVQQEKEVLANIVLLNCLLKVT